MSWVVVVGMKLGYTEKQIGHMTYLKFTRLYEAYKNVFDLELYLKRAGKLYKSLGPQSIDEVIPQ